MCPCHSLIRHALTLGLILFLSLSGYSQQVTLTATSGTGTGSFSTLKAAFDAINAGTHQGVVVININASTTETATAALNASGSGSANYTSISIYPTQGGLSISGSIGGSGTATNNPLISLNGADNVTIDGRVGATGSDKSLTITNTSTSSVSGTSTIHFINDATNNTVKYCTLKGSTTTTDGGIVYFSTGSGSGNDNNTIDKNDITCEGTNRPLSAVYALGSSGYYNDNNTISNNNIYNFLSTTAGSKGINIANYNSGFTISGNSFYETTSFVASAHSAPYYVIYISSTGGTENGFTISGNYIGGSAALCAGTAWTKTSATSENNGFYAISVQTASGTATSIQGNTIQNIKWTHGGNANFFGIYIYGSTVVNIGTIVGNTIGSATGTESIYFTAGSSNPAFVGVGCAGTGTVKCSNNTIGAITTSNASTNNCSFNGIRYTGGGTGHIISGNNISNITAGSASTSIAQNMFGIRCNASGTYDISRNTIANMVNATNGSTNSTTIGIAGESTSVNTITGNTIRDLSSAINNTDLYNLASVTGILIASTASAAQTVSSNTVYNLSNSNSSFAGGVTGIFFRATSTTSTVSSNFIHSLSVTGASSTAATLCGIRIDAGTTTYSNNIISLGGNTTTNVKGIAETGASGTTNALYFNTVNISGSLSSGATNTSYALYSNANTNTRDFRNNILVNTRSTISGANKHYALYAVSGGSLTCDYNQYYVSGTGGLLGSFGSDKASLPIVTGATGNDANSIATNPAFINTGTLASEYAPTVPGTGVTGTGITTDYTGNTRGASVSMGAIDGISWTGGTSTDWTTASNWSLGTVPVAGSIVNIPSGRTNYPSLSDDRTISSIALASGASFSLNGNTLTLTSGLINAGSISGAGKLTMGGSSAQTITGTGTISNLEVNNSAGVTITSGAGNLLSLTGTLTPTSGTLTTNGNLTLKSSASGTARVAAGSASGGYVSGNVTVERYIPAGRKWRFLAAPLTGSSNNSVFYNWQNNDVVNGSTGVEIWGPGGDANPSSSNTGLALGASASMRSYGSSGWQNVTNTNTTLLFDATTNYGYALFQTGPYNNGSTAYIGSSGSLPAGVATTLSATGSLITGDHVKSLTATSVGQYFLVANPYASPVNPALFTDAGTVNRTNLDNTLYMWDAKQGGTNSLGRYVSFSISGGAYSNGGAGTGFADNTVQIQSGQAFFVRATNTGSASLVFRESSKSAAGAHDMFGSATQASRKAVHLFLLQDSSHVDGAVAFFRPGASAGIDAEDGVKLMNATDNLGLRREGRTLVFEFRPDLKTTDTLFTTLTQMQPRSFRLRVALQGFTADDGIKAELVDRQLNQRTPLSLTDTTYLDFTVTADSASSGERFIVVFTKLAATGGGTAEPGEVIRMNPYPNPVVPGMPVRVDLDGQRAPWDMQLIDVAGRTVWQQSVKDAGRTQVRIDMSRMAAGVYQLLMTDGKGTQTVSRVVKP